MEDKTQLVLPGNKQMILNITGFTETTRILLAKALLDVYSSHIHIIALVSEFPVQIHTDAPYVFIRARSPDMFHNEIEGYVSTASGVIDKTDITTEFTEEQLCKFM